LSGEGKEKRKSKGAFQRKERDRHSGKALCKVWWERRGVTSGQKGGEAEKRDRKNR